MNRRHMFKLTFTILAMSVIGTGLSHANQTHIVQMKRNIFSPAYLEVNVGDTVRFVNVQGSHNTESIKGMIPPGAKPWRSKVKRPFEMTMTQEGIYGYKCTPHFAKGMIGLIKVGKDMSNLPDAQKVKLPKKAASAFEPLFSQLPKAP